MPLPSSPAPDRRAAATAPAQAVTATTIRVGIPYVDLAAVRQFGITLDQGSFPDAYNAIIKNLNAQGGINGRKLVPYLVAVNPVGTGPAITACTQLAEDDPVFVAIAPQQTDCFLQQHDVPTISGMFQEVRVHEQHAELHPAAAPGGLRPAAARRPGPPRHLQGQEGGTLRRRARPMDPS